MGSQNTKEESRHPMRNKIPTPEEVSPRIGELKKQRADLVAKATPLKSESAILRSRYSQDPGTALQERVAEVLGRTPPASRPPSIDRLTELLADLDAHNKAIDIIDIEIRNEEIKASRLVCEAVAPDHSRLARQFAEKVIELHAAHADYLRFINAVENTGARLTGLGRVSPYHLGSPKDPCGFYKYVLEEFKDNGHIRKNDIPECVR